MQIALWALDLSQAYRMLAIAREEHWCHGFIWADGIQCDTRCVFGSAHLVGFFQRVSSFMLAIARHEINQFDALHPYPIGKWMSRRRQTLQAEPTASDSSAQYIYLDDAFGLTIADDIRVGSYTAYRPQMHIDIASKVFRDAGWQIATDKVQLGNAIHQLGLYITTEGPGALQVPEAKRLGMMSDIRKQLQPSHEIRRSSKHKGRRRHDRSAQLWTSVRRERVEKLTGRCLHIGQIVPEAAQYLQPMFRMCAATIHVYTSAGKRLTMRPVYVPIMGDNPGQREYRESLEWWFATLANGVSTPLAPRQQFPNIGNPGCVVIGTDAAREQGTGFGGFAPVRTAAGISFEFIEARWPQALLSALQNNTWSMPAGELFGVVCTMVAIHQRYPETSHIIVFTDSDAARAAVNSAASPSPQLNILIRWACDMLPKVQFHAFHQPGARNMAADRISRSGLAEVLQEVSNAGFPASRMPVPPQAWAIANSSAEAPQRPIPSLQDDH